jgi:hypothetical protein
MFLAAIAARQRPLRENTYPMQSFAELNVSKTQLYRNLTVDHACFFCPKITRVRFKLLVHYETRPQ